MSTIVAPVKPPAMPAPTARMPPVRAPRLSGSASQSPPALMACWMASPPTSEFSHATRSLFWMFSTIESQSSTRIFVCSTTIGTMVAIRPTNPPTTTTTTSRIDSHRGMSCFCSQLTTRVEAEREEEGERHVEDDRAELADDAAEQDREQHAQGADEADAERPDLHLGAARGGVAGDLGGRRLVDHAWCPASPHVSDATRSPLGGRAPRRCPVERFGPGARTGGGGRRGTRRGGRGRGAGGRRPRLRAR